jgi:hypothetical protein
MNKLTFTEIINHYKSKMTYNDLVKSLHFEDEIGYIEQVYEEADALTKSAFKVIWFVDHDVYIKIRGYYSNFEDEIIYTDDSNSIGWFSVKEVRPFEIIKTTYKEIK